MMLSRGVFSQFLVISLFPSLSISFDAGCTFYEEEKLLNCQGLYATGLLETLKNSSFWEGQNISFKNHRPEILQLNITNCRLPQLTVSLITATGKSLQALRVDVSEVQDIQPGTLEALSHTLKILHLTNNRLTSLPNGIKYLKLLDELNVTGNFINQIPDANFLLSLQNLKKLMLDGNAFGENINNWKIEKPLKSLTHLSVSGNGIPAFPVNVQQFFPQLQYLNLSHNGISGNPWNCNCDAQWILHNISSFDLEVPKCSSPIRFHNISLKSLSVSEICSSSSEKLVNIDGLENPFLVRTLSGLQIKNISSSVNNSHSVLWKMKPVINIGNSNFHAMFALILVQTNGSFSVVQMYQTVDSETLIKTSVFSNDPANYKVCLSLFNFYAYYVDLNRCMPLLSDSSRQLVSNDGNVKVTSKDVMFIVTSNSVIISWSVLMNDFSNQSNMQTSILAWNINYRKFGSEDDEDIVLIHNRNKTQGRFQYNYTINGLESDESYMLCFSYLSNKGFDDIFRQKTEKKDLQNTLDQSEEADVLPSLASHQPRQFEGVSKASKIPEHLMTTSHPIPAHDDDASDLSQNFVFTSSGQKIPLPFPNKEFLMHSDFPPVPGSISIRPQFDQVNFESNGFQSFPLRSAIPSLSHLLPNGFLNQEYVDTRSHNNKQKFTYDFLSKKEDSNRKKRDAVLLSSNRRDSVCKEIQTRGTNGLWSKLIITALISATASLVLILSGYWCFKNIRKCTKCYLKYKCHSSIGRRIANISPPLSPDSKNNCKECNILDSCDESCKTTMSTQTDPCKSCTEDVDDLQSNFAKKNCRNETKQSIFYIPTSNVNTKDAYEKQGYRKFHPGYDLPPSSRKKIFGYDYPRNVPVNALDKERSRSFSSLHLCSSSSSDSDYNSATGYKLDDLNLDSPWCSQSACLNPNCKVSQQLPVGSKHSPPHKTNANSNRVKIVDTPFLSVRNKIPPNHKKVIVINSEPQPRGILKRSSSAGTLNAQIDCKLQEEPVAKSSANKNSQSISNILDNCSNEFHGYANIPKVKYGELVSQIQLHGENTKPCLGEIVLTGGTLIDIPDGYVFPKHQKSAGVVKLKITSEKFCK